MVGFSIFDLDTGPSGDYVERVYAQNYAYYVTPLRPSSGNAVTSTLNVDRTAGSFSSTALATPPSDPLSLTDEQAARAGSSSSDRRMAMWT